MLSTWAISLLLAADPSQEAPVRIRAAVHLVEFDVIVKDKQGDPVLDLKQEDFVIREEGRTRPIDLFRPAVPFQTAIVPPVLPPGTFSNRISAGSAGSGTVTAILLDGLNTNFRDQAYSRQELFRFLKSIRPQDRVALYVLGRSLYVLHDFSSDTESLLRRISQWEGENTGGPGSQFVWEQLQSLGPDLPGDQNTAMQRFAEFVTRNRILQTLSSLEAVARHLAGVTGRKNLIWISSGFPVETGFRRTFNTLDDVRRTACTLNDCNVAIYPVDARGLFVDPQYAVTYQEFSVVPEESQLGELYNNIEGMRVLAEMTGGKAFYNRNDIAHAIADAAEDGRSSYLLGYYRPEPPDNRFKEIQVKVNRPDVTLRYRKGFVALRATANAEVSRQSQLELALWSPLDDRSIGLEAFLEPVRRNKYRVTVRVDPSGINLQKTGDGWTGRLEIAFASKDVQGRSYGQRILDTVELNLKPQTMIDVSHNGISYRKSLVFAPEASLLRIVVRDPSRGLLGSLTIPLRP